MIAVSLLMLRDAELRVPELDGDPPRAFFGSDAIVEVDLYIVSDQQSGEANQEP